ncbi:MAG TPA: hypothetical protein VMG12_11190 [Polyangiaceae bacterium]|nr:hypothetical protein [Polyangiaceae bacterium]
MNQSKGTVKAVQYSRSFGPFGSELCNFNRAGSSVVHLSYNYDHEPELGFWRGPISEAQFDELVHRLHESHYDQLEVPSLQYPGEFPLSIGELREGEERPTSKSCPLDLPQLKPVMQSIADLMAEVRKNPVSVLRGQARWTTPELRQSPFEVQVTLENVGIEPFQLTHPGDTGQAALTVFFNAPNRVQRGLVVLGGADVIDATPAATGPALVLAPGERLTFEARGRVPVVSEEYRGTLVFKSWVERGDGPAIQHRLDLDLGPVVVRPEAANEENESLYPRPPDAPFQPPPRPMRYRSPRQP